MTVKQWAVFEWTRAAVYVAAYVAASWWLAS